MLIKYSENLIISVFCKKNLKDMSIMNVIPSKIVNIIILVRKIPQNFFSLGVTMVIKFSENLIISVFCKNISRTCL